MSLGLTMTMPMLVVNMSAEMIYILEQRLIAQNVKGLKRSKVIGDVIRAMCKETFQDELYRPQPMQSPAVARQIFSKLAHSSVMRLNSTSMEKLFDLLSMGYKYQILCCPHPRYLLDITLKKLEALNLLVLADAPTAALLDAAKQRFIKTYHEFSDGDYYLLKQSLCRFFQGKRVKVSIFLQGHMQNLDGSIVLNIAGFLPEGTDIPGICRVVEQSHCVRSETLPILVPHALKPYPGYFRTTLGDNLYQEDTTMHPPAVLGDDTESKQPTSWPNSPKESEEKSVVVSAADELNLLSSLIAGPVTDEEPITLNLIGNHDGPSSAGGDVIFIDLKGNKETSMKVLSDRFGLDSVDTGDRRQRDEGKEPDVDHSEDDEDNLLSMMDRVK